MKNVLLEILVIFLKILYLPMKLFKVKDKITYMSRESNTESLDFKMIRQELEKEYPEYENIILCKKIEDGILNKISYCGNVFRQMYHLATSKVIVLDTYSITACVLSHKKKTKIIQIWHALGAIKKFGYQTIGTKSGSNINTAKIMCMHKNYDYVLAPSVATAKNFEKAFNVGEEKIKYIGLPRIDYILHKDEQKKKEIFNKYNIQENKQLVVYVPTFRRGGKVELDELVEKVDTNKYILVIKLHPLDWKNYTYKQKDGVIYDTEFKSYDWLKIADKIITDYSSLSIESSLLNIPIYFYTYDLKEYKENTGLNFDFANEEIGKYNTGNVDDLLKLMEEKYDYKSLENFKNKYISIDTNNCTKQVVEFIARLLKNEEIKDLGNEPIKEEQTI